MRFILNFATAGWGITRLFTARFGGRSRRPTPAGKNHHVRFEDLSPHVLRDLGLSTHHAQDLMAREYQRFLS